ncbi:hypothetical protein C8R44DRAFT_873031 [Mycena epipterygia]|nr:hypothetical protein C8R44DRAFT_873031 [Mycena epipterygia]
MLRAADVPWDANTCPMLCVRLCTYGSLGIHEDRVVVPPKRTVQELPASLTCRSSDESPPIDRNTDFRDPNINMFWGVGPRKIFLRIWMHQCILALLLFGRKYYTNADDQERVFDAFPRATHAIPQGMIGFNGCSASSIQHLRRGIDDGELEREGAPSVDFLFYAATLEIFGYKDRRHPTLLRNPVLTLAVDMMTYALAARTLPLHTPHQSPKVSSSLVLILILINGCSMESAILSSPAQCASSTSTLLSVGDTALVTQ